MSEDIAKGAGQAAGAEQLITLFQECSVATVTHWLFQKGYRNAYMQGLQCLREDVRRLAGRVQCVSCHSVRISWSYSLIERRIPTARRWSILAGVKCWSLMRMGMMKVASSAIS